MEKQTIFYLVLIGIIIFFYLIYILQRNNNDKFDSKSDNIRDKLKFESIFKTFKSKYYKIKSINSIFKREDSNPIVYLNTFPKFSEPNFNEKLNFTVYWKSSNTSIAEYSWIGVYPYGQRVGIFNCLNSFYLHKKLNGVDYLKIPTSAGYYDIRYIQDNNQKALQTQGPIVVNPTDSYIRIIEEEEFLRDNLDDKVIDDTNFNSRINFDKLFVEDRTDIFNINFIKKFPISQKIKIEWKIGDKTIENIIKETFGRKNLSNDQRKNLFELNELNNIFAADSNFKILLCLTIIGSDDSSNCLWEKEINDKEYLSNKIILEIPNFAGYFYFRILRSKNNELYESKEINLVVGEIFKISSDEIIMLPNSLESIVGSSITMNYFTKKPNNEDWIGLFNLADIQDFVRSVTPLKSTKFGEIKNNYGNFTAFLPPNSQAGQFVFVYFKNNYPISISDIIEVQQPKVSCQNNNNKNKFIENILNSNKEDFKNRSKFWKKDLIEKEHPFGETKSKIKHLVIICTENHSFDSYYGNYCEAEAYSNPDCNIGPKCCEKPPEKVDGYFPKVLNDTQNMKWDPNHNQYCELCEINNGKMDGFVKGCSCSSPDNFAVADVETMRILHEYSRKYAMSDMFFQPSAGASSQNDMYFARGAFVFTDNRKTAIASIGSNCWYTVHYLLDEFQLYYDPSITSLLSHCNFTLRTYTEGYNIAKTNFTGNPCYPNGYDSADIPFNYFAGIEDKDNYITDYLNLKDDIFNKTLPEVSFIKPLGNRTAHPSFGDISSEMKFVKETVDLILDSDYKNDTLILYVPDESGGYYDHVPTPPTNIVDGEPYGPRIPFVAIGKFAKKNYISHIVMEHSSIIKFIEWNWLNGETGQLNTRDRNVNGIGDLIDPEQAGIQVP